MATRLTQRPKPPAQLGSRIFNAARPKPQQPVRPPAGLGTRIFNAGRVVTLGSQPRAPLQAPGAPAPPAAAPGPAAPADPRDSRYFNDLSRFDFQAGESRRRIGEQSAFEKASMAEAIRRLTEAQPQIEQRATNGANSRGLLFSGALGQQIGDLRTDTLRRQTDAQNTFDQHETQRRGQLGAIDAGLIEDRKSALQDAIDRAVQGDLNAPLVAPPEPPGALLRPATARRPVAIAPRRKPPARRGRR